MNDPTGDSRKLRDHALQIYRAAVSAADPRLAVSTALESQDANRWLSGSGVLGLLAFGKAARGMAQGVLDVAGKAHAGGLVVTTRSAESKTRAAESLLAPGLDQVTASHPLPDSSSQSAAAAAERWLLSDRWDRLLVLVSGGGSALLCAPMDGLSLSDKLLTTQLLMKAGASIGELNTVRKHLSRIKGGGLARRVDQRPVLVLVLSDVPGDDLATIASGPLVGDPTTFAEALAVVDALQVTERLPRAVREHLRAGVGGGLAETPKPGDACFQTIEHRLVGGNSVSVAAAAKRAESLGYQVEHVTAPLVGGAREVGRQLAARTGEPMPERSPWAMVGGGETTVEVVGQGRGGRNQELALAFALARDLAMDLGTDLALGHAASPPSSARRESDDGKWLFLSAGTDGIDGPTDAAGAMVDAGTCRRAEQSGLDPAERLADNDSYSVLEASGDLLMTGPSGTNVADIQVYLSA